MAIEKEYLNEYENTLYKERALEIHKIIPSGLTLDEEYNVWKVSTTLPIDEDNLAHIEMLFLKKSLDLT